MGEIITKKLNKRKIASIFYRFVRTGKQLILSLYKNQYAIQTLEYIR